MGIADAIKNYFFPKEETHPGKDLGRNDSCWCGSGMKYKKCHLDHDEKKFGKVGSQNCAGGS